MAYFYMKEIDFSILDDIKNNENNPITQPQTTKKGNTMKHYKSLSNRVPVSAEEFDENQVCYNLDGSPDPLTVLFQPKTK